jgi:hypothetical protein
MCKEPINREARVCPHCMSHQDWREHMGLSQSVLALLIALISVGTVFIPVLQQAFVRDNSDLEFSFQATEARQHGNYNGPEVIILATNKGPRPGTIYRIYFSDSPTPERARMILGTSDGKSALPAILIEREASKLVTVFFRELLPKKCATCPLFVLVAYRDFDGQTGFKAVEFPF